MSGAHPYSAVWTEAAPALSETVEALRAGRLTARAYAQTWLARIAQHEERVRAWVEFDAGRARELAQVCDTVRAAGRASGALHGVPIGVKDILATAGLPTRMGSPLYANHQPERDAAVVQRLQAAGAYVMGKTVTTEFAFMHPGVTCNPWNVAHTPGGSSSGSAAAVAAGFVPIALGTQTNGSVIRPAAYCGVVGYKPTFGTVPSAGCFVFSATLDQIGVFARRVDDAAYFAAVLMDDQSVSAPHAVASPRLAYLAHFPWNEVRPPIAARHETINTRLRAAGAHVETIVLPAAFESARRVHRTIMMHEAAREHMTPRLHSRAQLSPELREGLDEGAAISSEDYQAALAARAALMEQAQDLLSGFDAVLSPAAPGPAPAGLDATGDPSFATLWSLLGVPAITIPAACSTDALPLGLQLAAGAGADVRWLGVAQWFERALAFDAARAATDVAG
jgi:Asp-tRNA(Asn)/Glu-tRNA(Gln) amidotransferase A subunit family amidase